MPRLCSCPGWSSPIQEGAQDRQGVWELPQDSSSIAMYPLSSHFREGVLKQQMGLSVIGHLDAFFFDPGERDFFRVQLTEQTLGGPFI
jgi:hypothetical protein